MIRYAYYDEGNDCIAILNEISEDYSNIAYYEVPDGASANDLYIFDNELRIKPPRPNPFCTFDRSLGVWVDPRTESDWTTELYARREVTSMSRADFIIHCVDFGVFNEAEGIQAASGTISPTMQSIIDDLPTEEQFQATVIWAASSTIFRTNTLIINMAAAIFIDEWTLDEVFGVEWPEPLPSWPGGKLHP